MENYPRTEVDTRAAVRAAKTSEEAGVLAVVSVSASGLLRDRVVRALEHVCPGAAARPVHVIVDAVDSEHLTEVEGWISFDELNALDLDGVALGPSVRPSDCPSCRDPRRAQTIQINPRSFQEMLPGQVKLLMPDHVAACEMRRFWELCDEAGAIGIQELPAEGVRVFRPPKERMGIRVRLEELLVHQPFFDEVVARFDQLAISADLILVSSVEAELSNFANWWSELSTRTNLPAFASFPISEEWPADLIERITQSSNILAFALGTVTGSSLQRALVAVQAAKRAIDDTSYELNGLVIHARPASNRDWEALINSWAGELRAIWPSVLPDWSPLEREGQLLDELTIPEDDEAKNFVERRRQLIAGGATQDQQGEEEPLFWGGTSSDRITPHSIFGEGLRSNAIYAAVGHAMESKRASSRGLLPELRRFEMRALVRSYYDPLILAAVLRWLEPGEAEWGEASRYPGGAVVTEMVERTKAIHPDSLRVLLPELLLAAAQGKLSSDGRAIAVAEGQRLRDDPQTASKVRAALVVGLAACEAGPDS